MIATSFPFPSSRTGKYYEEYLKGISVLNDMGFSTREAANLDKSKWWCAGSPEQRASDINEMFSDSEIKAIIVHDGGQSAIATLEHIDYSIVKNNPKPLIGFSDITNIHIALFQKTGLVGFHGPLLTYGLGKMWWESLSGKVEAGKTLMKKFLTETEPIGKIKPFTKWKCLRPGRAEGRLFGGNLSMILSLVGTRYFPDIMELEGNILFWEIYNTASYWIERGLYVLKYAGILDKIAGMLIGKLPGIKRTSWEGFKEPGIEEIIIEVVKEYDFPIIADMDFGHETVDMPMPIGINASIDARELEFSINESVMI